MSEEQNMMNQQKLKELEAKIRRLELELEREKTIVERLAGFTKGHHLRDPFIQEGEETMEEEERRQDQRCLVAQLREALGRSDGCTDTELVAKAADAANKADRYEHLRRSVLEAVLPDGEHDDISGISDANLVRIAEANTSEYQRLLEFRDRLVAVLGCAPSATGVEQALSMHMEEVDRFRKDLRGALEATPSEPLVAAAKARMANLNRFRQLSEDRFRQLRRIQTVLREKGD